MPSTTQDLGLKIACSIRAGTAFPYPAYKNCCFYRTDLNELYMYDGANWVQWRTRDYTIVVAASNSLDPTLADPAYRCDGTDDQAEINNAITSLGATGGAVILLDGTYGITASVKLASKVTLMGQGAGTVLRVPNGHDASLNVISSSSINHALVANLKIDGNKANQTAGVMHGVYFDTVTYSKVVGCWVEDMWAAGIYVYNLSNHNTVTGNTCQGNDDGILLNGSSHNTMTGNTCQGNDYNGIHSNSSSHNTMTGNTCQGNGYNSIYLEGSSHNTMTGNTCQGNGYHGIYLNSCDNNTVSGNTCTGNGWDGISLDSSSNSTVSGNTCQGNEYHGIYLDLLSNSTVSGDTCTGNGQDGICLDSSSNSTVSGNTCQGNGWAGICVFWMSHNNTVTGNTIGGNSQSANNTNDGIWVNTDSNYNNIQGNTVRRGVGANKQRYGIRINTADCDGNLVINNDLYQAGVTGDYSDAGTGTVYHNNRTTAGWVP